MGLRFVRFVTLVGVLLAGLCISASASPASVVLHLRFHRVAVSHSVSELHTSEDYALLTFRHGRQMVIDDQTGTTHYVPGESGCPIEDMADPWVLFGACGTGYKTGYTNQYLYNLKTRKLIELPWGGRLDTNFVLGSHWLWQSTEYCGTGGGFQVCQPPTFYSLPSLAQNEWQPHGNVAGDVDSAALERHVCWPVSKYRSGIIGPLSSPEAPEISALVWGGKLTVELAFAPDGTSYTAVLEGCSGTPRLPLFKSSVGPHDWLLEANQGAVIWSPSGPAVRGIFIPSLRRFRTRLPVEPDLAQRGTLNSPLRLTSRHVWLLDSRGRVWEARFPPSA